MPRATSAALAAATSVQPGGLVILVVEDDEADAYLICRALTAHPAVGRVVRAVDGVEALEKVERGELAPDLAFIDLQMPRKGGLSLLTDLGERAGRPFPMVVLTSSTAAVDAVRSRLSGALRVVSKPETVEAMEAVLASAIDAVCPRAAVVPAG